MQWMTSPTRDQAAQQCATDAAGVRSRGGEDPGRSETVQIHRTIVTAYAGRPLGACGQPRRHNSERGVRSRKQCSNTEFVSERRVR
ncbi:hypothetical protein GCM10009740_01590 [Terrabacter terrae]|uniref:Uncharacterized protein n=1 Tax=Terrabacter terrae TaxID=318434 RepID=A0ABN2TS94_9MICO